MQRPEYRYEFQPWKVKLQGFKGLAPSTWWSGLSIWLLLWILTGAAAWASTEELEALKRMSIDDLANLEVSIVSGRPERLGETAAAVFVITAGDIRRSGATTLPEVLRMVPGLSVGRIKTSSWAISARGFQSQVADKLLVLIDGRSVYTTLFSGVLWESQDIVLQDIERIEVVRGPGATTWGANAVNGVINIITRRAQDTQGIYVGLVAGDRQRQMVTRQGGRLSGEGAYRFYAKLHEEDLLPVAAGHQDDEDAWRGGRAGFRADWPLRDGSLMLEGEFYKENAENNQFFGNYLLGRQEQQYGQGAVGTLQGYYYQSSNNNALVNQTDDTVDLEYRLRFPVLGPHTVMAGVGYRWIRSDIKPNGNHKVRDPVRVDQLFSAFIQDDIHLLGAPLYLTLGTKLEHNDYTGFEVQPGVRLRWLPTDHQTLWAAISRAVRTPSRSEADFTLMRPSGDVNVPGLGSVPLIVRMFGNHQMASEELLTYEAGYRWQVSPRLSFDAAVYLNDYDRLRTFESVGAPDLVLSPTPMLVQGVIGANQLHGRAHGLEVVADYQPWDWWRIQGAYSFLRMDLKTDAGSSDRTSAGAEKESPAHQWTLRSSMNLSDALELDLWLRYVAEVPILAIDSYTSLDVRLGWRISQQLDLSLVGRNLLGSPRVEYKEYSGFALPRQIEVEREAYLMAEWRF